MNSCGDLLFLALMSSFWITGLALDMAGMMRAKEIDDNSIIQAVSNKEEVKVNSSKVILKRTKVIENASHPIYHELRDTYCTPRCDPILQMCIGYNRCTARTRCGVHFDCPVGQKCTNNRCVMCIESDDCPSDKVCVRGVCTGCYTDSQCAPGLICHHGDCMNCWHDHHCYGNQICYGGKCTTCQNHMHCPGDTVCVRGACKVCEIQEDCGGYGFCIDGQCRICTESSQCRGGYMCIHGLCKARLLEDLA